MKLEDALATYLVQIDADLAADELPLWERPLRASIVFVEEFVESVSVGEKRYYLDKEWFAVIYHHVNNWYLERYGSDRMRNTTDTATGVVLVRGVTVELRVPLTRTKVEKVGETAWLMFPVEVEDDEDARRWLVKSPTLSSLGRDELADLLSSSTKIASALRAIRMYLMGVEPSDVIIIGLLEGVLAEFEGSARNILRNDPNGRGAAVWSVQMAVERTLKAFARHKLGAFREIHSLFELFDDVAVHCPNADRELLKKLPRQREVMDARYGLGDSFTLAEVIEIYQAGLLVVAQVARQFKRKFGIAGGGVLIKKAPWISLPSSANQAEKGASE